MLKGWLRDGGAVYRLPAGTQPPPTAGHRCGMTLLALALGPLCCASRAGVAAQGKPSEQQQLGQVLAVLVRGVTLLGLLATCCGPWYAYVLLRLVYGRQWADTEAPLVLSFYTGYILLLAVNGEVLRVGTLSEGAGLVTAQWWAAGNWVAEPYCIVERLPVAMHCNVPLFQPSAQTTCCVLDVWRASALNWVLLLLLQA